jgi:hypothetical protein
MRGFPLPEMRISQYIAVLDSCVLVPMPVADTLLRLAEEPAFYSPRWSQHILSEVERVLRDKWKYPEVNVKRRIRVMRDSFPEALVTGYEELIDAMKNATEDRHVLAAAVRCGGHAIVSPFARQAHYAPGYVTSNAPEAVRPTAIQRAHSEITKRTQFRDPAHPVPAFSLYYTGFRPHRVPSRSL